MIYWLALASYTLWQNQLIHINIQLIIALGTKQGETCVDVCE